MVEPSRRPFLNWEQNVFSFDSESFRYKEPVPIRWTRPLSSRDPTSLSRSGNPQIPHPSLSRPEVRVWGDGKSPTGTLPVNVKDYAVKEWTFTPIVRGVTQQDSQQDPNLL